jgi:hypothetical protein
MVNTTETAVKKFDLNKDSIKKAIARGKELTKAGGKTKADVAREIYEMVKGEDREVIVQVFQQGATLTERGAMTYFYNIKRKLGKSAD